MTQPKEKAADLGKQADGTDPKQKTLKGTETMTTLADYNGFTVQPGTCPTYKWCDSELTAQGCLDGFHRARGFTEKDGRIIVTTFFLDDGKPLMLMAMNGELDPTVSFTPETVGDGFAKLKADLDAAEQQFADFQARVGRELHRRTEPGQPAHEEVV